MKATLFLAGMASTGLAMPATEHWGEKELLKVDIPTDTVKMEDLRATKLKAWEEMRANGEFDDGRYHAQAMTKCEGGKAGDYACMNMDLMHFLPHADMGSKSKTGNDVWGWTSKDGREFGAFCQTDGTAFVEVLKDGKMVYLGRLPTQTSNSSWRDAKLIGDHMYIGSEASNHGLQIFDMKKLLEIKPDKPKVFDIKADIKHFSGFGSSHNIVANPDTHMIYAVGTARGEKCKGGLWMVDVKDPNSPKDAGCVGEDGYTHDAECVIYKGPHKEYQGREICFNYNEKKLSIFDVTDRGKPKMLSRIAYEGVAYTHQGWIIDKEQRFLALDDEQDEMGSKGPAKDQKTVTYIADVSDLTNPKFTGVYKSPQKAIDHNLYVIDGIAYEANYGSGLRVVDMNSVTKDSSGGSFKEIAYFDVRPEDDKAGGKASFNGAWSVYPYFKSGNILINSIERGGFSVKMTTK